MPSSSNYQGLIGWTLICLSLITAVCSDDATLYLNGATQTVTFRTSSEDNLRMRDGSPFKIALFADLHFGEDAWTDWGPRQDVNSVRVMSTVLDQEQPGLGIYAIQTLYSVMGC